MEKIYLDNAASSPVSEEVLQIFIESAKRFYANQEALGDEGKSALRAVNEAGECLAGAAAPGWHVQFLNTATDAIEAGAAAHFAKHPGTAAVTTHAEHPAMLKALERHAGQVVFVPVESDGKVRLSSLAEAAASGNISFCGIHHVNAETGVIQDLREIRKCIGPRVALFADTTQSVCKMALPAESADFMCISGAKIGAPCGGALLYRMAEVGKEILKLRSKDHGFGRCVPAAAIALSAAVCMNISLLEVRSLSAAEWKRTVLNELEGENFHETVPGSSPYILHLLFPGIQGAVLVRLLGTMGVTLSAGSACLSETPEPSAVLRAMGFSKQAAYSAIRISLGLSLRPDAKVFAKLLKKALKNY